MARPEILYLIVDKMLAVMSVNLPEKLAREFEAFAKETVRNKSNWEGDPLQASKVAAQAFR